MSDLLRDVGNLLGNLKTGTEKMTHRLTVFLLCFVLSACSGGDEASTTFVDPSMIPIENTPEQEKKIKEAEEQEQKHQRIVDSPELFDELSKDEKYDFLKKELHALHFAWYAVRGARSQHVSRRNGLKQSIDFWLDKGRSEGLSTKVLNSMLEISKTDREILNSW